jgi:putative photosynthetic complex assembly protein
MQQDALDDRHVSPTALKAIGVLLLGCLIAVAVVRLTGVGGTAVPLSTVVEVRALNFEDRPDGAIAVYDAGAAEPFEILPPKSNGFLRGMLRAMARGRKLEHVGRTQPFEVVRWADGRLSLRDPAVGTDINLEAFGRDNFPVFKRFLTREVLTREIQAP